ncbi:MAG TPA: IS630 family transposase [Mycobacteriales bacterium]|nr:IS630 family transposase [Mycobacteriales bacterium]
MLTFGVQISAEDRATLQSWSRSTSIRAGLVTRAKIVLAAGDGLGTSAISATLGVSRPTVIQWRERYVTDGLAGLGDAERSGRPKTVDDSVIIAATLVPPPERLGVTHWSTRLLAAELKIGDATVARAWRRYCVKPWKRETFKFSTDPELEAKVRDVVGLYLNPPEKAVVLCVDESGRAGARHRSKERRVSPTRPPNPACASPRTGLSTESNQ